MTKRTLSTLVVVVMALGLMAASAGVASAGDGTPRPFRFSEQADFEIEGTCESGAARTVITGSGRGTHLGHVSIAGYQCAGEETGVVIWTTANRDEIVIVFSSQLLGPPEPDGSAPIAFYAVDVSGTGRFENVDLGDEPLVGTVWFYDETGATGHLETAIDGTIIYDASERRR